MPTATPTVIAVGRSPRHGVGKELEQRIHLIAGQGIEGDAHCGATVRHRSRVARDPAAPNLRQVHLIAVELIEELRAAGFDVAPGRLGENVTTHGVDLLALPSGARVRLGADAVVEVTGLRNPCRQLDGVQAGLMAAVLGRDARGRLVRRAGVMAVVVTSGDVTAGDALSVEMPAPPHRPLRVV